MQQKFKLNKFVLSSKFNTLFTQSYYGDYSWMSNCVCRGNQLIYGSFLISNCNYFLVNWIRNDGIWRNVPWFIFVYFEYVYQCSGFINLYILQIIASFYSRMDCLAIILLCNRNGKWYRSRCSQMAISCSCFYWRNSRLYHRNNF